jgi:hypothetical protein
MDMVGEISHELARHEIDLLLIADDDLADKHSYMRMVQSRRVDALIVAHTLDHDPRLEQLQAAGFPFLALGRSRPQPYAWFDFDNYAGTYQATRWLIEKAISALRCWAKATIRRLSPSAVRAIWTPCGKPGFPANGCAPCRRSPRGVCHHENCLPCRSRPRHHYRLQHPRRRRGDGAGAAGAFIRRPRRRWWSTTACRRTASSILTWRR